MNIPELNTSALSKLDAFAAIRQTEYQRDGLTKLSNNDSVVIRDENGNIVLQGGTEKNQLLVIEPTTQRITNASMLRVLNTQFTYFKFPARTTVIEEESVDLDLDLDLQTLDTVFARYRPSEDQKIIAADIYSGILMDEVQDGLPQQTPNTYTITKDLKNSGIDLRFRIKLRHQYDAPTGYGTAYFSIIKSGEDGLKRDYRTFENTSEVIPNIPGSINRSEIQNLEIDIVIPNSEFEIGDKFGIGAKAGQNNDTQYHTIDALQSYWVISDASKNVDLWNQEIRQAEIKNQEIDTRSRIRK
jgi:hypothetical protein